MRRAILEAFPDLAGEAFSIAGKGWHSLAVDVGGRLIFKFPKGEEAEAALRREAGLLAAIAPYVTLPIPKMSLHDGPVLFSRHEKLPGETLDKAAYHRLNEDQKEQISEKIALLLISLHNIPDEIMTHAGAQLVEWWDTADETLAPIWPLLPPSVVAGGRAAIESYRALGPDPLGEPFGFFDAHGWNMAFDHRTGTLNGMFDFADSGFGPVHREFAPLSLIAPEMAAQTATAYDALSGRTLDRRRIFLLTAAMRLSEFAGALEMNGEVEWTRDLVIEWFTQRALR